MFENMCKTTIVSLAFVALIGSPTTQAEQGVNTGSIELSWNWLPASADAFLDGAVGNMCSGGTYELNEQQLAELFPMLTEAQGAGAQFRGLTAAAGCEKQCTCGACLVISGQVACAACYACCAPNDTCDSNCASDIANQIVTSSCDCIPEGNTTRLNPPVKVITQSAALEYGEAAGLLQAVEAPLASFSRAMLVR